MARVSKQGYTSPPKSYEEIMKEIFNRSFDRVFDHISIESFIEMYAENINEFIQYLTNENLEKLYNKIDVNNLDMYKDIISNKIRENKIERGELDVEELPSDNIEKSPIKEEKSIEEEYNDDLEEDIDLEEEYNDDIEKPEISNQNVYKESLDDINELLKKGDDILISLNNIDITNARDIIDIKAFKRRLREEKLLLERNIQMSSEIRSYMIKSENLLLDINHIKISKDKIESIIYNKNKDNKIQIENVSKMTNEIFGLLNQSDELISDLNGITISSDKVDAILYNKNKDLNKNQELDNNGDISNKVDNTYIKNITLDEVKTKSINRKEFFDSILYELKTDEEKIFNIKSSKSKSSNKKVNTVSLDNAKSMLLKDFKF